MARSRATMSQALGYAFEGFFESEDLADMTVLLSATLGHVDMELPGHSMVLAGCSPVFKAQLMRWQEQPASSQRSSTRPAITLQLDSTQQLEAARALMEFMYKQQVPKGVSQQLLVDMLQLADRYDVQLCVAACGDALSKQELEWATMQQLLQLPPAYSSTDSPPFNRILGRVSDQLQHQLGDLEVGAWASSEGRESFLALPLKGVELLLSDQRTRVAYENTALVAVTAWVQQHSDSMASEEKQRLAELIRLPRLSLFAGLYLANTLTWLAEALGAGTLAAAMSCAAALRSQDVLDAKWVFEYASSNQWPASCALGRRPQSKHQKATLEWKVSLQELQQTYTDGKHTFSPAAQLGGLQWRMMLFRSTHGPSSLGVALIHELDSSVKDALCLRHGAPLPAALLRGSLVAVRPGLGAAAAAGAGVPGRVVFPDTSPNVPGVSAGDLWQLGAMREWDPQRFEGWVGADGLLTLRLEVVAFM